MPSKSRQLSVESAGLAARPAREPLPQLGHQAGHLHEPFGRGAGQARRAQCFPQNVGNRLVRHAGPSIVASPPEHGTTIRDYHNALATLAREAATQRRWRDAGVAADRWLASEPLSEEAARLAVESLFLSGNRGGALARFAGYREALHRETGCEPGRALRSLMERVEADRSASDAGADPRSGRNHPSKPASSGARWNGTGSPRRGPRPGRARGEYSSLQGESGVGKSRLADEFLRWVVADGGTVLRGRSYDGRAGMPYEPVADILREALGAPGLAGASPEWLVEVARLVPELRQRFPSLAGASEACRLDGELAALRGHRAAAPRARRRAPGGCLDRRSPVV